MQKELKEEKKPHSDWWCILSECKMKRSQIGKFMYVSIEILVVMFAGEKIVLT